MWIMTSEGWVKNAPCFNTPTPSDDGSYRTVKNGYLARNKANQWAELAALVVPEKYER